MEPEYKCKELKYLVSYIILCLSIANILWYMGYSDLESDYAIICIMAASFLPMLPVLLFWVVSMLRITKINTFVRFRKE